MITPFTAKLNQLSHSFPYNSEKACLCAEAAQHIVALEKALRNLLEYQGHVALNTVGDVRLQCKLMRAREDAAKLLEVRS